MNLWIRSQDKMDIMKVESLHIDEIPTFDDVNIICYTSGDKYSNIGNYKNKKRALEVLDEIEEYINNNCEFIERKDHTSMGTYINKIRFKVYEMPKE